MLPTAWYDMKNYTKVSVNTGEWHRSSEIEMTKSSKKQPVEYQS